MFRKIGTGVGVFAIAVAAIGIAAWAQDASKTKRLAIGDKVPEFMLNDLDGNEHKLSDYKDKIVVLDFVSMGCPWSRGHDASMPALADAYKGKGVVVLGIDADKDNSVDAIRGYAKKSGVTYMILKDEGNKYADAVNAKQTPEIFIVDKEGALVYHGAYDNRKSPDQKGDTNYVAEAIDALLANQPVKTAQTKAWGCGIKRMG